MAFDFLEQRQVGDTGLKVPLLGMGCVQIAGWPRRLDPEAAQAAMQGAWDVGIRYFDTAPMYGIGRSEERAGAFLQKQDRDSFILSSKVGRLLSDLGPDEERDQFWADAPARKWRFDFSYDGVMQSVEDSLNRLGLDRIDILHIHDPDDAADDALAGANKALVKLRDEGTIKAVGAGMNQNPVLTRFAREGDFNCFLLAGRYTVLDQSSLETLMPACEDNDVSIIIGGVYNSGALIDPSPQANFDYNKMDDTWLEKAKALGVRMPEAHESGAYWLDRATRIKAACERHGVSLKAAAMQFAAAHPRVASIVVGAGTAAHIQENVGLLETKIPDALWDDLKAEGLVVQDAPTP